MATPIAALGADWDRYLDAFTVELPDAEMQAMVNVWNPIQCRANLFWSRFASGYDTGLGRGMGTRDSAQDTLGTVQNAPEHAKGRAADAVAAPVRRTVTPGTRCSR